MLSLNLFARRKFFIALEIRSLFKLCKNPFSNGFKIYEINGCKACDRKSFRFYSTEKEKTDLVKSGSHLGNEVSTGAFETVKDTTKTVTYSGIIVIGLGITIIVLYTILQELFSGNSANNVYSKALDRCLKNEKVVLSLGEPIKAFGDEYSRVRRSYKNHLLYTKDGINYIRMKFFIRGSRKKATVHLEMKENDSKNFEYQYLFVQLDEYPYTTIVLEDNRRESAPALQSAKDEPIALM